MGSPTDMPLLLAPTQIPVPRTKHFHMHNRKEGNSLFINFVKFPILHFKFKLRASVDATAAPSHPSGRSGHYGSHFFSIRADERISVPQVM